MAYIKTSQGFKNRFRQIEKEIDHTYFKTEWNELETAGAESIINSLTEAGKRNVVDFLGLAYTSSSDFAQLGACSNYIEVEEGFYIDTFAIPTHGFYLVAIAENENNEQKYYEVLGKE